MEVNLAGSAGGQVRVSERYFPFRRLGFRSNPFRTLSDTEWVEVAVWPATVTAAVEKGFAHLQLLGQKGCGKTTILLALADYYACSGRRVAYEYLPKGKDHFTSDPQPLDLLVLDEAQRLAAEERRRLLALATGRQLIVSSHADLSADFSQHGLDLATVRLDQLPGEVAARHLARVFQRRLDHFRIGRLPAMILTPGAARYLNEEFGPNMRAAEQFLYEYFQYLAREPEPASHQIEAASLRRFHIQEGGQ